MTINEATQTQTPITTDTTQLPLDNETVETGSPLVVNVDYSYAEAGKIALALLEYDENGNRDEIHLTLLLM